MRPPKLYERLLLTLLLTLVLTGGSAAWLTGRLVREQLQIVQQERLQSACRRAADLLPDPLPDLPSLGLEQQLAGIAAETGCQLTVVARGGRVLAHATPSPARTDEASTRSDGMLHQPELVMAASLGQGVVRYSARGRQPARVHLALRVPRDGKPSAFVRGVLADEQVEAVMRSLHARILAAALLAFALTWPLVWRIARQTTRPLDQLAHAARQLAAGEYVWRIETPSTPDVRAATVAFDRMGDAVRKREEELRENLSRRSAVLGGMLEGVIAVDRHERILFANLAAGKLLGFTPQESEQRTLLEAARIHPLRTAVRDVLRHGEPCRRELQWHGPPQRELEIHAMPLPGSPCPGVVLVLDDVTQLRRLEGARQQFIANVSHELKTPLSSIKAYTETLLHGAIDDPAHNERFLQRIAEQADRLHQLILDMLSLSRIETGQAVLDVRDVDLKRVADKSFAEHAPFAESSRVELQQQIEPPDIRVRADEESLRQILDNLIDNAIKYTPAGGKVTLSARRENQLAVIEVADTGTGISPEHLDRLFERFYRVDHARSRELGGTGLGLSIVKHLALAMGGSVQVQSQIGQGSVFSVRLPWGEATRN